MTISKPPLRFSTTAFPCPSSLPAFSAPLDSQTHATMSTPDPQFTSRQPSSNYKVKLTKDLANCQIHLTQKLDLKKRRKKKEK